MTNANSFRWWLLPLLFVIGLLLIGRAPAAAQPPGLSFALVDQGAGTVLLYESAGAEPIVLLDGLVNGRGLARTTAGDLYVVEAGTDRNSGRIWHIPSDGAPAPLHENLDFPEDIAVDPQGGFAVTELAANRVIYFPPNDGEMRVLAQVATPTAIMYVDQSNGAPAPGFIAGEWFDGGLNFIPLDGNPVDRLPLNMPSISGLATGAGYPILVALYEQGQVLAVTDPRDQAPTVLAEGIFTDGPVRLAVGPAGGIFVTAGPDLWAIPPDGAAAPAVLFSGVNLAGIAVFPAPLPPTPTATATEVPTVPAPVQPTATATAAPTSTVPAVAEATATVVAEETATDSEVPGTPVAVAAETPMPVESGVGIPAVFASPGTGIFGLTNFGLGLVVALSLGCLALVGLVLGGAAVVAAGQRGRGKKGGAVPAAGDPCAELARARAELDRLRQAAADAAAAAAKAGSDCDKLKAEWEKKLADLRARIAQAKKDFEKARADLAELEEAVKGEEKKTLDRIAEVEQKLKDKSLSDGRRDDYKKELALLRETVADIEGRKSAIRQRIAAAYNDTLKLPKELKKAEAEAAAASAACEKKTKEAQAAAANAKAAVGPAEEKVKKLEVECEAAKKPPCKDGTTRRCQQQGTVDVPDGDYTIKLSPQIDYQYQIKGLQTIATEIAQALTTGGKDVSYLSWAGLITRLPTGINSASGQAMQFIGLLARAMAAAANAGEKMSDARPNLWDMSVTTKLKRIQVTCDCVEVCRNGRWVHQSGTVSTKALNLELPPAFFGGNGLTPREVQQRLEAASKDYDKRLADLEQLKKDCESCGCGS